MNPNSLRSRVTTFYVGMLAIALVVFSAAVYFGVQRFLTFSMERSLINNANSIVSDLVAQRETKGDKWFLTEISESYPEGASDTFVRVSSGDKILYRTGDMRDPYVNTAQVSMSPDSKRFNTVRREWMSSGQELILYTVPYRSPTGALYIVETGASTAATQHILGSLFLILLTTTPLILVVAAVGGYMLMSQPLRPVVTLTERAERVGRMGRSGQFDQGERLPIVATGDELERLTHSLNSMIERLEATVAHNCRFSADASHELRTPLTIIRGELEALIQTPSLQPSVLEGAGSALEECNRMATIVDSLMTISRLEGGGERMEMAPVDLVSIARSILDHMSLLADEKEIALSFAGDSSVLVPGDAMRLKQVIVNLVDNALKYTPDGGAVKVTVSAAGGQAVLSVSDTGIGIPPDALPLIFERFYRADQVRSRDSGGIGLGLSIVKSICVAHHGTIFAESVLGQGSTLRVELPLLVLTATPSSDPSRATPAARRTRPSTSAHAATSTQAEDRTNELRAASHRRG